MTLTLGRQIIQNGPPRTPGSAQTMDQKQRPSAAAADLVHFHAAPRSHYCPAELFMSRLRRNSTMSLRSFESER